MQSHRLNVLFARQQQAPENWCETASCLLKPLGVRTFEAPDAAAAIELAQLHCLHLLVVDAALPHRPPGLTLWRMIRVLQQGQPDAHVSCMAATEPEGPPVILLTAPRDDALLREALTWNVFSVLPQPVDWQTLLDAMARALARYHQGRWPETGGFKAGTN